MTDVGDSHVASVLSAVTAFERGEIDVEDVQSRIRSASTLVEGPQEHLRRPLELAEADLEEIRFAKRESEQRPAALAVVERLRRSISAAREGS